VISLGSAGLGATQQVGALFVGFWATHYVAPGLGAAQLVCALFVGFWATHHIRVRHGSLLPISPSTMLLRPCRGKGAPIVR
jgi:hypothetical protein